MNNAFKKMTRVVAWVATASLTIGFAMMPTGAAAIEFFPTPFRYQWKSQNGTDDGVAHVIRANKGDTVPMTLTITNRSIDPKAKVIYGKSALTPEVAPYRGAHELRLGTSHPHDTLPSWIDPSSFIANPDGQANRFAVYDGAAVNPGEDLTFSFNLKISSTAPDATYDLYTGVVREYDAWARQVNSAGALLGSEDIYWRVIIGAGGTPPASTGALTMALSSATPASASVAKSGNANFTKFSLTAVAGTTVKISSIYVTRDGLTADTDVENIKILTADGVQVGNTSGGFDANHRAQIFFTPQLAITGTSEYYIRAGFASGATTGLTARLGIAANSEIVSDATSVGGAPVWGNPMTAVAVTIGTIGVSEDGSVADSTPDIGDTNVIVNTFKITAGSTEGVNIDRITVLHAGSSANGDTTNIELWDVTHNVSLGNAPTWTADGKASWPVNISLGKGDNIRLRVQLDIVNGVSLTVNADIADGSDYLVFGKGATYGFYITPTAAAAANWGVQSGGSNNLGQGDYNQTINSGAVTISKSATTPGTGNIAVADNQLLAVWDWQVLGESTRISAVTVRGNLAESSGSDVTYADLTNGRLVDMATGNILAGPVDGVDEDGVYATDGTDPKWVFSNTFVLAPGITKVGFKVRLGTDFANADTIIVTLYQASDITAKGVISNNTITPTGLAAAGNTQTVKAGAMTMRTLGTPPTGNVIAGTTGFTWGEFALDATASGEDANVTALLFTDTLDGTTADMANIDALVLYADLNGDNTFGSDEAVTNVEYPTGGGGATDTHTFTLTKTVSVVKGTSMKLRLVGNLSTAAVVNGTHAITLTSGTVTGASTGTDISEGTSGSAGTLTVATGGSVTTALAASNPVSALVVAGSTYHTLGAFDFVAADEAYTIDTVTFDLTAGYDSMNMIKITYPLKAGGTESRETSVSAAAVAFSNIAMYVPKNGRATMTVTGTAKTVGTSGNGGSFRDVITLVLDTSAASEFNAVGEASGNAKTGSNVSDQTANNMYLYDTVPTVVASNPSGAGTIVPGSTINLYKFKVTADAAHDLAIKSFQYSVFITDASTTTASAADLTNFTILRDGVDITSSAQITEVSSDGSSFIATPLTLEATNYLENNTSYWVQVAFGQTPTGDTEQEISAGQTVEYTLRALAGTGFTTTDAISTGLLQDTDSTDVQTYPYLSDEDTGTGVQQVVALQKADGTQYTTAAGVHFIWSDKSTVSHVASFDDDGVTETSSADWSNGYLVKNFPLSAYGYTL